MSCQFAEVLAKPAIGAGARRVGAVCVEIADFSAPVFWALKI
jgi:hypothetical protein